ncbi:MAG: hypothetical protein M3328_09110 [Chloroflexota bacterium]|nr:hypothetical protein [Chloroflexota bacterium]
MGNVAILTLVMTDKIVARILREIGVEHLLEVLGEKLAPTDLQSLLLAVFRRRAGHQTPQRVLEQYEHNAFVRPALVDVTALLELDRLALDLAVPPFEPIELSPLAPLGTSSALAPVDQNKVVTTIRNTEVVSDSTNVLALECALRRRAQRKRATYSQDVVRLCASHRLVRAQRYTQPNLRAHFRMFTLCTAGRDDAEGKFVASALSEQLGFYLRYLAAVEERGYHLSGVRVTFTPLAGEREREHLQQQVMSPLAEPFPAFRLELDPNPTTTPGYYGLVRFQVYATDSQGVEYMIGDGGFNDWTQKLLSDRRERLLTSGIATERLATLFRTSAAE